MEGTSMAAPHLAGVAALLLQAKPTLTSEQLKNAIASSARRDAFTSPLVNSRWGYGKVDAAAAMGTVLSVRKISDAMPASFSLEQNYPNPFNPSTRILYELPAQFHGIVTLTVFDLLGKNVATLVNEFQQGGVYSASWNAETASSGVYYCILRAGAYLSVKKMILMR
jgi:subtilisin family serine protease